MSSIFSFILSVKTILLIVLFVVSGVKYFELVSIDKVEVRAFQIRHKGPWERIRGGNKELFLKIYYQYIFNGKSFIRQEEHVVSRYASPQEILDQNKYLELTIDGRYPEKIISENQINPNFYLLLFSFFYFLFWIRYFHFKIEKNVFSPY